MAIKFKAQRDYLLTEANIELPCNLADLDYLMRSIRGTGRIVAVYVDGGLLGVNLEQRTKMTGRMSDQVRALVDVDTREIR